MQVASEGGVFVAGRVPGRPGAAEEARPGFADVLAGLPGAGESRTERSGSAAGGKVGTPFGAQSEPPAERSGGAAGPEGEAPSDPQTLSGGSLGGPGLPLSPPLTGAMQDGTAAQSRLIGATPRSVPSARDAGSGGAAAGAPRALGGVAVTETGGTDPAAAPPVDDAAEPAQAGSDRLLPAREATTAAVRSAHQAPPAAPAVLSPAGTDAGVTAGAGTDRPAGVPGAAAESPRAAVEPTLAEHTAAGVAVAQSAPEGTGPGTPGADLAPAMATGSGPDPAGAEPEVLRTPSARPDTVSKAAQQIATVLATGADGQVEIALDPEELGPVRLRLSAGDGVMTVALAADRSDTLDLFRRHADILARELRAAGFDAVSFSFGTGTGAETGGRRDETAGADRPAPAPAGADQTGRVVDPGPISLAAAPGRLDLRL